MIAAIVFLCCTLLALLFNRGCHAKPTPKPEGRR